MATVGAQIDFWRSRRGVGFTPAGGRDGTFMYQWCNERMLDALEKASSLGFGVLRTWGTTDYEGRVLEMIQEKGFDLKVQLGVWTAQATPHECQGRLQTALDLHKKYPDLVVGISLGNEGLNSEGWSAGARVDPAMIIGLIDYARKSQPSVALTYNFASEAFTDHSSFDRMKVGQVCNALDYVNIHLYGEHVAARKKGTRGFTPTSQLQHLIKQEAEAVKMLEKVRFDFSKPLVIGETGWMCRVPSKDSLDKVALQEEYFRSVSDYVYNSGKARMAGMFYFNLSDEGWKGAEDDGWGLYAEGDDHLLGQRK